MRMPAPSPVSGIAACGSAMGEVDEHLEALADDVVAFFAANAGHEAHAAGIVLIARVIETLGMRKTVTIIRCLHWYLLLWNKVVLQIQFVWNGKDTNSVAIPNGSRRCSSVACRGRPVHTGLVLNFL